MKAVATHCAGLRSGGNVKQMLEAVRLISADNELFQHTFARAECSASVEFDGADCLNVEIGGVCRVDVVQFVHLEPAGKLTVI